jgi:hypothetical protein
MDTISTQLNAAAYQTASTIRSAFKVTTSIQLNAYACHPRQYALLSVPEVNYWTKNLAVAILFRDLQNHILVNKHY